jgi:uncharacterized lipoprotein YmbA
MKTASAPSRRRALLVPLLAAALVAACSAPKQERFHSLLASELPAPATPAGLQAVVVDMLPVGVPPLVDQPQWVVRASDDTLQVLEQERWAAPLREELRSALAEQLAARWAVVNLQTLPQPATSVWRLRLDLQRFESVPGREARIDGTWSLLPPRNAAALVCHSTLRESVGDGGVPALAAAHRRLVARLADEIGQRLQALQRGEATRCD